jgi:excisionase family DNA binding protein
MQQLLNKRELAEMIRVSKSTISKWVSEKKIPFLKLGTCVRFNQSDIQRWLRDCEITNGGNK